MAFNAAVQLGGGRNNLRLRRCFVRGRADCRPDESLLTHSAI